MYNEFEEYELYEHKRSDKVKWAISFILIIVLLAGLIGAWIMLLKPEEVPPEQEAGGAVITEGEKNGMTIKSMKIPQSDYGEYGISTMAETAYSLTVTITPETAENKAVDWTIAFVDPDSEWSAGKTVTDFVTVTPTADGALTANVACIKSFGEQIKVTATSRDNTDVTGNCLVDYTQKLSSVKATFGSTVLTDGITKMFDLTKSGQAAETWKFDYSASVYTIKDDYKTTVKISFSESASGIGNTIGAILTWDEENITAGMPAFDKTFFDRVFKDAMSGPVSENPSVFNKLVMALTGNPSEPGIMLFDVEVKTVGTYGSKTDIYQVRVLPYGLNIRVEGMEMSDSSIIF